MLTEKGLTLSQIEKILPLVDKLGVLPIAIKFADLGHVSKSLPLNHQIIKH